MLDHVCDLFHLQEAGEFGCFDIGVVFFPGLNDVRYTAIEIGVLSTRK